MSWLALAAVMVTAGLGGALGVFLGQRLPRHNTRAQRLALIVPMAMAMVLANYWVAPRVETWGERRQMRKDAVAMFGDRPAADHYVKQLVPVLEHPRLRSRLARLKDEEKLSPSFNSAQNAGAHLFARGVARLSDETLEALFAVLGVLADSSPAICAAIWTGGLSPQELGAGLRELSDSEQRTWIEATAEAMRRELDANDPVPTLPGQLVTAAMQNLQQRLSEPDRELFAAALDAGPAAAPKDACAAFRLIVRYAHDLSPADRATLIRSLSAPAAIAWDEP